MFAPHSLAETRCGVHEMQFVVPQDAPAYAAEVDIVHVDGQGLADPPFHRLHPIFLQEYSDGPVFYNLRPRFGGLLHAGEGYLRSRDLAADTDPLSLGSATYARQWPAQQPPGGGGGGGGEEAAGREGQTACGWDRPTPLCSDGTAPGRWVFHRSLYPPFPGEHSRRGGSLPKRVCFVAAIAVTALPALRTRRRRAAGVAASRMPLPALQWPDARGLPQPGGQNPAAGRVHAAGDAPGVAAAHQPEHLPLARAPHCPPADPPVAAQHSRASLCAAARPPPRAPRCLLSRRPRQIVDLVELDSMRAFSPALRFLGVLHGTSRMLELGLDTVRAERPDAVVLLQGANDAARDSLAAAEGRLRNFTAQLAGLVRSGQVPLRTVVWVTAPTRHNKPGGFAGQSVCSGPGEADCETNGGFYDQNGELCWQSVKQDPKSVVRFFGTLDRRRAINRVRRRGLRRGVAREWRLTPDA